MAIESPKYSVVSKQPNYEVRQYEPYIQAQVEIESGLNDAVNEGFNILAGYIFGDNKARTRIAMTAPVTEELAAVPQKIPMTRPVTVAASGTGRYIVSFTMPHKYTIDTLPEPNNKRVYLREVAHHKVAAVRFPGRLKDNLFERKEKEIRSVLERDGIAPKSNSVAAQYDPPWVPGFLRRNEILIDI